MRESKIKGVFYRSYSKVVKLCALWSPSMLRGVIIHSVKPIKCHEGLISYSAVWCSACLQAHGSSTTDRRNMIYFFSDEWTNLLPCCPVRLICYDVTPCRLFPWRPTWSGSVRHVTITRCYIRFYLISITFFVDFCVHFSNLNNYCASLLLLLHSFFVLYCDDLSSSFSWPNCSISIH